MSSSEELTQMSEESSPKISAGVSADTWKAIIEECSESNWDGYGALPVSRQAIVMAECVRVRLKDLPRPELGADPDGEASMDWHTAIGMFSISVNADGRAAWAMLIRKPILDETDHGNILHYEAELLIPKIKRVLNV